MGLGGLGDVSLAQAREAADRWRSVKAAGRDPIKERERLAREEARSDNTLAVMTAEAFEARKAELKGDGKAGRWLSPLEIHVLPKLGRMPVQDIDQRDIRDTLLPIWHDKAETARKALNRLGIVLEYAAALGLDVDLQATTKAKALLGKTRYQSKEPPFIPWENISDFYLSLEQPSIANLAMRFAILTGGGSRLYPVRHLRLAEIKNDVWTIPGEKMKGQKGKTPDFRMPLSAEAIAVVELAKPFARDGFLFPNVHKGVISDMTLSRLMERRGLVERPHSLRKTFRTWLADCSGAPEEVAEACIAHKTGTATVNAYRKTDWLDQRRILMERWSDHVTGGSGRVVQLTSHA